jgi:SAM-dependent methyltransferase
VACQHPLAYLLGMEGLALLRAWAGDFDRSFVLARLAEVRRLIDSEALLGHPGVEVPRRASDAAYAHWAPTYDEPNTLFDVDEPVVHELVATWPAGVVLDAACGTGRYAEYLVGLGHSVIGVDRSEDMLDRARVRVSGATFHRGDLADLPLENSSVDWPQHPGELGDGAAGAVPMRRSSTGSSHVAVGLGQPR